MNEQDKNEIKQIVREVVKEALTPIDQRLDETTKSFSSRFEGIDARLLQLPTRVEVQTMIDAAYDKQAASAQAEFRNIYPRFDALEARIVKLEERLGLISRRLDNIDSNLSEQRSTTYQAHTEVEILRERLADLEARIAKLEGEQHGRS